MAGPEDRTTYTPTTHRISRAKKGKRVHACTECGKVFTRAEHLRRHRMNHNTEAQFRCDVMGCAKAFHREDLLKRHKERHNETQGLGPSSVLQSDSRRPSSTFSMTSVSPLLSSYGGSPSPFQHQMLAPPSQPLMPYLDPSVETPTPHGQMTSATQTLNASLLSPLAIPSTSGAAPAGYTPDLAYGPSDESPLHSSNSSCYSGDFSARFPAQMYGIPPRSSSGAAISAPESTYYVSKPGQPAFGGASSLPWSMEEPLAPQTPHVLSCPYEASFLPPVGTPPVPVVVRRHGLTSAASARQLSVSPVVGGAGSDLRYLMLGTLDATSGPDGLGSRVVAEVEHCIGLYWTRFDPLVPIVHGPTFSWKGSPAIVVAAMVVIGAQYSLSAETRHLALAVHKRCRGYLAERANITSRSPLPDIQCVLLSEFFAKFRSKPMEAQPSTQFKILYGSLFDDRNRRSTDPLARLRSWQSQAAKPDYQHEWLRWIDLEARRRITLAAFLLDAHQATLFEQDFCQSPEVRGHANLCVSCPSDIWECESAQEWTKQHGRLVGLIPLRRIPDLARDFLNPGDDETSLSLFETAVVLSFVASSQAKSGNGHAVEEGLHNWRRHADSSKRTLLITYHAYVLSLHVILRDLLAGVGESWVLGQDVGQTSAPLEARTRLRRWAQGTGAKRAVWHAAQGIRIAFEAPSERQTIGLGDGLHEQWCVYVSALVCWAYGFGLAHPDGSTADVVGGPADDMWLYLEAMDTPRWEDVGAAPGTAERLVQTSGMLACVGQWIQASMSGLVGEGEGEGELVGF
ncbi:MAG: hypothetical protein M1832_001544 [Thelocarpon impressellum]|nr:MAG: hypothetical protein M1832_001544 [Thelocarpon impressellum]